MTEETIELRLEGEIYRQYAEIADLADVSIESIIRVAMAMHLLRFKAMPVEPHTI